MYAEDPAQNHASTETALSETAPLILSPPLAAILEADDLSDPEGAVHERMPPFVKTLDSEVL